jgi:hypothetical protein
MVGMLSCVVLDLHLASSAYPSAGEFFAGAFCPELHPIKSIPVGEPVRSKHPGRKRGGENRYRLRSDKPYFENIFRRANAQNRFTLDCRARENIFCTLLLKTSPGEHLASRPSPD